MAIDLVVEKCGEFQFVPAESGHVMPTRGYIIFKLRGDKNALLSLTEEPVRKRLKDGLQLSEEDFRAMLLPHGIYLWNWGDDVPGEIKGDKKCEAPYEGIKGGHNPDVAARHRQARAFTNAELAAAIDYAYNKTATSDLGLLMRKHLEILLEIQRKSAAAILEVSSKFL